MDIQTHRHVAAAWVGSAESVKPGFSRVRLLTTPQMAVDESGLVHGGFIFGTADYAAMIAVNHPNVVLGSAEVRFLKPVRAGETVIAEASVHPVEGKKHPVSVRVLRGDDCVFQGSFTCFIPDRHVLSGQAS